MERHADYALTAVFVSLMLFALVQLGFNNDAHAGEEGVSVTAAGKTVVLTAGTGTVIVPGQAPSQPFEFSEDQLDAMLSELMPPPTHSSELPPSLNEAMPSLGEVMNVAEEDIAVAELRANSTPKPQDDSVKSRDR